MIWIISVSVFFTACGPDPVVVTEGDLDRPDEVIEQREEGSGSERGEDRAHGTVKGLEQTLGACRDENERWEMFDVQLMFSEARQWYRVPGGIALEVAPSDYRQQKFSPEAAEVRVDSAWSVDESETDAIVMPAWIVDRINDVYEVRPEMYVSTSSPTDDPGVMTHGSVFMADADDVALVANCGYAGFTQALHRYATEFNTSSRDVLETLLDAPESVDGLESWMYGPAELPDWEDRDSAARALDHDTAPAHIIDQAVEVGFSFDVASDLPPGIVICATSAFARSGCVDLSSSGSVFFSLLVMPGYDLELRLSAEPGDGTIADRRSLGTIDADVLEEIDQSAATGDPRVVHVVVDLADQPSDISVDISSDKRLSEVS